jgi:hypothetical protein
MATTFLIHSTVRGRHNRTQRAAQPAHHRFKQYIGDQQLRLIRGRPLALTEEAFQKALPEIKAKAALGILEVRTPGGERIDLETLQPVAPAAPSAPLPNPPADSIANDQPWGETIPRYAGDEPDPGAPQEEPKLLSGLESTEEDEEPPAEGSSLGTSPTEPAPSRGGKKKGKR